MKKVAEKNLLKQRCWRTNGKPFVSKTVKMRKNNKKGSHSQCISQSKLMVGEANKYSYICICTVLLFFSTYVEQTKQFPRPLQSLIKTPPITNKTIIHTLHSKDNMEIGTEAAQFLFLEIHKLEFLCSVGQEETDAKLFLWIDYLRQHIIFISITMHNYLFLSCILLRLERLTSWTGGWTRGQSGGGRVEDAGLTT